jgi:hypothetical protein
MGPPPGFEVRAVAVEPGVDRIYHEAEWRDAIVVIVCGEIELHGVDGDRNRFGCGDILWLVGLPVRAIHNPGAVSAVLVAVSRQ